MTNWCILNFKRSVSILLNISNISLKAVDFKLFGYITILNQLRYQITILSRILFVHNYGAALILESLKNNALSKSKLDFSGKIS